MSAVGTALSEQERRLLALARNGDEGAYRGLVEPHWRELHAHCYRMLGSVHDAEDALQDAMLRAWRGLPRFDGRGSVRPWLYKIATNTSLDVISRRPKRVLPIDHGPSHDPHEAPGEPIVETVWVEPYPDEKLGLEDGYAAPEARYERRESVELAFIAAVQQRGATPTPTPSIFTALLVAGAMNSRPGIPPASSSLHSKRRRLARARHGARFTRDCLGPRRRRQGGRGG